MLSLIPKSTTLRLINRITSRGMASAIEEKFTGVFVTTPDTTAAKKIANGLVEKKLAACVNIIPQITSIYFWEGKINEDAEVLLMIKTRQSRVDDLIKFVTENHPYSVPEVISLPIEKGNPAYLEWIAKTVPEKAT